MRPFLPVFAETPFDSRLSAVEAGPAGLESIAEGLHFGRSWHRYRYVFRKQDSLRVLDAGCGTGRSTLGAAWLNRGASVIGVDASAASVDLARERATASGRADIEFRVHDLNQPLPASWGRFDFIVCHNVLGQTLDPAAMLAALGQSLDPAGLIYATFPSHVGRHSARALRQAIEALAPADAGLEERARIGLDLFQALRSDHPIRVHAGSEAEPGRFVDDVLAGQHDWTLDGAVRAIESAGLTFLYAATTWRWRPDRVFAPEHTPDRLLDDVGLLSPAELTRLIDALDPSLLEDEYHAFACPADYNPPTPAWPESRISDPTSFDVLVPHLTGLARPSRSLPSAAQGRFSYPMISGVFGELDRLSSLMLSAVDGVSTCGMIDRNLTSHTRASDEHSTRQDRWINLADSGLILLEPPSPA